MSDIDLKEILLETLEYTETNELRSSSLWPNGRGIPSIENAYFIQDVPVAYFSRFDSYPDTEDIWKLYRSVWSQSKVPLLYVILPGEIRIYNSYAGPPSKAEELDKGKRLLQHLRNLTSVETARQEIRSQLNDYRRINLETGVFWGTYDGQLIKREKRADQQLLQAIDQVRRKLIAPESGQSLSNHLAYALIGRSIFIRYLEARGVLDVFALTQGQANDYLSLLELENLDSTYLFFGRLSERFNGDLFPVDKAGKERKEVTVNHLNLIRDLLKGYRSRGSYTQYSFWRYDFAHIPIEIISGIYDTFLYDNNSEDAEEITKKRRRLGAYYTPLPLVDFVVEETLPADKIRPDMTILDPACGSGVFLVRAFQKLVAAWKRTQQNSEPSAKDLSNLLKEHIFGVDKELNSIEIAAFSLYLAMLDYLKKEEIENKDFRFPNLKNSNLFIVDFFSKEVDSIFAGKKFDRVIGNLPWGRGTMTDEAERWLKENNDQVAGRQIVQAFLLRIPGFCATEGEIALLAPVKSTILVSGNTYVAFRRRFFEKYHVRALVNLSVLRHELFPSSVSPSVILFYRPHPPLPAVKMIYGVPKPSLLSQRLGAIVLDGTEIKFMDRAEMQIYPVLWKVASWGSPRDAALIERLQSLPTLKQQAKKLGWKIDEGFMAEYPGSDKNPAPFLTNMPFIPTEHFQPYVAMPTTVVEAEVFHRPRTPEIYRGPLVLIHKNACLAALSVDDIAYASSLTGVRGNKSQEDYLKWLVAYINSPLVKYYQFLTSSRWAVERDTPVQGEYESMPFLLPARNDLRLTKILDYFDKVAALYQYQNVPLGSRYDTDIQKVRDDIDNLVFDIYNIGTIERQLIRDMVNYEVEFFYWVERKRRNLNAPGISAIQRPDSQMLGTYADIFVKTATTFLRYQNQTLNATVYYDGAPLNVVQFDLVSASEARDTEFVRTSSELTTMLHKLDRLLLEQHATSLYTRRHLRIFDHTQIYLIRPNEKRLWTHSQAYDDVDSFIAEALNYNRNEIEV